MILKPETRKQVEATGETTMKYTDQTAFTAMVNHLRAQNARSVYIDTNGRERCSYYGDNGRKCPVGVLIPNDKYAVRGGLWEGNSAIDVKMDLEELKDVSDDLLMSMQRVHDQVPVENWEQEFKRLSMEHNLELPPL